MQETDLVNIIKNDAYPQTQKYEDGDEERWYTTTRQFPVWPETDVSSGMVAVGCTLKYTIQARDDDSEIVLHCVVQLPCEAH